MYENNKDYLDDVALLFFGRKITYKELFERIDDAAKAFKYIGVSSGEIVTVALTSIPEALYCVYALNRIGAVANMIHPLAGKEETIAYFKEVNSKTVVVFDGAIEAIAQEIEKTSVKNVIVASPADSLPFPLKIAYKLKTKECKPDGKAFRSWRSFIQDGKGTPVNAMRKTAMRWLSFLILVEPLVNQKL